MEIKLLPPGCSSDKRIQILGLGVHFTSAINVEPSNPFDMQTIWNMLHDLNLPKEARKFYPACAGDKRKYASYNELIGRNEGEDWLLVKFGRECYHAGKSLHNGRDNCNVWMPGVALVGTEQSLFTNWQYRRLAEIAAEQRMLYGFPNSDIVGHDRLRYNAIQAGQKNNDGTPLAKKYDPSGKADGTGKNFDWILFYSMVDALIEQQRLKAKQA